MTSWRKVIQDQMLNAAGLGFSLMLLILVAAGVVWAVKFLVYVWFR